MDVIFQNHIYFLSRHSRHYIFSVPAFLAKLKKQRKGLKWWLWEVVVIGGPALRAFIREF